MSEKRRDSKNRILRLGEQQRADGRYLYSTIDPITKKRKFLYSWKLEKNDKLPEGKSFWSVTWQMEYPCQVGI